MFQPHDDGLVYWNRIQPRKGVGSKNVEGGLCFPVSYNDIATSKGTRCLKVPIPIYTQGQPVPAIACQTIR